MSKTDKKSVLQLFSVCVITFITVEANYDGFVAYCPCMGRFGNQADHFLGALAFSKSINRTLILPPWVEYRYGERKSIQVPFETYFEVKALEIYHSVITMEKFMDNAELTWPKEKRVSFCYTKRIGETEESCNAKSGNPFGPFWDTYGIDFYGSEFYGPLNYDAQNDIMVKKWKEKYPAKIWPVLAFTGAPASFPVQKENLHLQKYLQWSENIALKARNYIKEHLAKGAFIGIHLRNGKDWLKACEHVKDSPTLFSSPQCLGYRNEHGYLTMSMCLPKSHDIIKQIKKATKKVNDIKYVYVASDSNYMMDELKIAMDPLDIVVVRLTPPNPHVDLAILGQSNYFIGNCVSSFTAFVKRERDVKGFPSEFWSFPQRKKVKNDEL